MALFKIQQNAVRKLVTKDLDFEKNLQNLFESNLEEILNVIFLAHEYSTSFGGRIDTLGIDKNGDPVIIEYKKSQNDNVINQGLSYLKWLLDHKADFEALCKDKSIAMEIDWDSPRVICIASSYNKFDIDTADILPINIELLKYRIYEEGILYLEPESYQKVRVSTSRIIKKESQQKIKQDDIQKSYSLDDHLYKVKAEIKKAFLWLREKITSLDESIIEEPKKKYVAYKTSTNFVDVVVLHKSLKIFINIKSGKLKDPDGIARDLTKPQKVGHWGNGDYEIKVDTKSDLNKVFDLIIQSYNYNK